VGDLARVMLEDEVAAPSKEKAKTIKKHIANWSKAVYIIVSVGRSSVTNGPIYTVCKRLENGTLSDKRRVVFGNRIQIIKDTGDKADDMSDDGDDGDMVETQIIKGSDKIDTVD